MQDVGTGAEKNAEYVVLISPYRIAAEGAAPAGFAVAAHPHLVELVHRLLHNHGVVGEDAGLEVAGIFTLHPDARAGKVGAADIDFLAIEDEHLKVHARTERPFHPVDERRVLVEVLAKRRSRFLGVDEPNFNALADKLRQQFEERHLHTVLHDVRILDVGGADPKHVLHIGAIGEHAGVVGGIGDAPLTSQHRDCYFCFKEIIYYFIHSSTSCSSFLSLSTTVLTLIISVPKTSFVGTTPIVI